ncbi:hypothetical protein [Halolamina salifodinae]|uniref:Ribosomal protein S27AE n=1 Tax=Halolamina salifodinae TaxID=1202767 RepID=A0A8T4GV32_9EURY|nr:hypothetical protein [Halolamina salifodinae]MBP1985933.1 ribosomal protein S27AE [Halolamina salifodinae]
MTLTEEFADDPETEPPVPVQASGYLSNHVDDIDAIPANLVDDEHVAKINDTWVIRAGVECPNCGSHVFLHPRSIVPRNSIYCFNCSHAPTSHVWWETPTLDSFSGGESA